MKKRTYSAFFSLIILAGIGFFIWLKSAPSSLPVASINAETPVVHTPKADKPDEYIKLYNEIRTRANESGPRYKAGYKADALMKARNAVATARPSATYVFTERGPANVPGRTRSLIVDPDDPDHLTWFAGGVGGGIWKTTDGGSSWVNKTENLPNLGISCLVMAESDHNILYAGTGEGWGSSAGFIKGSGIYKSTDRGETWSLLTATVQNLDFQMVNRIVVDPADANILLAATSYDPANATSFTSGIFKSTDGGTTWVNKFNSTGVVQQIVATPADFNVLYAAIDGQGVYKSTDAGETWQNSSNGLYPAGRIEMAVSPANANRLYASVVGNLSGNASDLYTSIDAGANWYITTEENAGNNTDFLGGQGWYDNTILAHPFNQNMVYVGGVNLWKFEMQADTTLSNQFIEARENGTRAFMGLVNFGADYYNGRLSVGDETAEDFVSVEVRFGPDGNGGYLKQMAHRYVVPVGQGSGVPASDYTYVGYTEVPFQVWDTKNNRQLMIAFRDQQKDGVFNLIYLNTDNNDADNNSREYIYISNITYDAVNPDPDMAQDGGHESRNLYFFWPFLDKDAVWDETNLPASKFEIIYDTIKKSAKITSTVSDAYGQYTGANRFYQSNGATLPEGLHPDHHNIVPIIWNESANSFQLLVANDGGIYKSDVGSTPGEADGSWEIAGIGYNTSQFYAVDKAPGENRYVGGLQDNGSWMSPPNIEGSSTSFYRRANAGDGFGTAWNHANASMLLTTVYYNAIDKSTDGGTTFTESMAGLSDTGSDLAPFITKVENLHADPNVVYTIGASGVWRSEDFADTWELAPINSQLSLSSSMHVKVSIANPQIVWAGNGMRQDPLITLHVSTDDGKTFNPTTNFTDVTLGNISGLATHPVLDSTAFALFSFAEGPKILRTDNLGASWYDISGFGTGTVSANGFPDVAVYDLLVMPYDTAIIWAGTEIGIFESSDAGNSWHILAANMPAASVWDLKIVDDQVVVGTHGRGIWSATIPELPGQVYIPQLASVTPALNGDLAFTVNTLSPFDSIYLYFDNQLAGKQVQSLQPGVISIATTYQSAAAGKAFVRGFYKGVPYTSHLLAYNPFTYGAAIDSYENDFETNTNEFFGVGFTEGNYTGLTGKAIHSEHWYSPHSFHQYVLKKPIRVRAEKAFINFQEIVLVEPGNNGALPGTKDFADYVVVQGSLDGVNWVNLVDEYDANATNAWRAAYINGEDGTDELYRFRAIDLLDTFNPGDEVIIRFVLYANSAFQGWGWAIDKLHIQTAFVVAGLDDARPALAVSLYPNPVKTHTINLNAPAEVKELGVQLYDLKGRLVYRQDVHLPGNATLVLPQNIKDGIYTVLFRANGKYSTQKIILSRYK